MFWFIIQECYDEWKIMQDYLYELTRPQRNMYVDFVCLLLV